MYRRTIQQGTSDLDVVEQQANGRHNGHMRQELLRQFQRQGVTQPYPVDFTDAISPRPRQNGSDPSNHRNGHGG